MSTELAFDRFLRYRELTETLQAWAEEHLDLLDLSSIGKSYEGRDIWLCTVTNTATGPADEKPAIWIDANIHATEVTGSMAAMFLVQKLLSEHGTDPQVTRALDTRTFYVVPRISPDGAELALAERPTFVRSSSRPYPRTDQQDGLVPRDMDADGRILSMRIPDPQGTWKVFSGDHRLLVPREPDEDGPGPYYRLLVEGEIENYDGITLKPAPALYGLDMNRNYPVQWRPEAEQRGAGPYPTSEPEIRAVVQAIVERRNVCAFIQYHTYSGVHLRPSAAVADDKLPTVDVRVFKKIGEKATELTGYPAVSVFHDFKYDPKDTITGTGHDWAYEHIGVHGWTTEFWNPMKVAGIEVDKGWIDWSIDHPIDDDLKILAWADEHLPGEGYVDWYPYDHPQLGPVELGGWNTSLVFRNPPAKFLRDEIAPHADWAIWHVLISPRLEQRVLEVEAVGTETWRVRFAVANTGWLPTNVTQKAVDRKAVLPLELEISVPEGAVVGDRKVERGQLTGRAGKHSMLAGFGPPIDATTDVAHADWVVKAPPGSEFTVEARHDRAGIVRVDGRLG